MKFGYGMEITKEQMPSYGLMNDYPTRQYSFMQDTLNTAIENQMALSQPQNAVAQPVSNPRQGAWNGQQ